MTTSRSWSYCLPEWRYPVRSCVIPVRLRSLGGVILKSWVHLVRASTTHRVISPAEAGLLDLTVPAVALVRNSVVRGAPLRITSLSPRVGSWKGWTPAFSIVWRRAGDTACDMLTVPHSSGTLFSRVG